jgi:hypothetical protein
MISSSPLITSFYFPASTSNGSSAIDPDAKMIKQINAGTERLTIMLLLSVDITDALDGHLFLLGMTCFS